MEQREVRRRRMLPLAGALTLIAVVVACYLVPRAEISAASWMRDAAVRADFKAVTIPTPVITNCEYQSGLLTALLTVEWTLPGADYGQEDAKVRVQGETITDFDVDGVTTPETGGTYTTTFREGGLLPGLLGGDGRLSILISRGGWESALATVEFTSGLLQDDCQVVTN